MGGREAHQLRNSPAPTHRTEQLLSRNVERLRGGLVFKDRILVYHLTLGSRVITKSKKHSAPHHQLSARGQIAFVRSLLFSGARRNPATCGTIKAMEKEQSMAGGIQCAPHVTQIGRMHQHGESQDNCTNWQDII